MRSRRPRHFVQLPWHLLPNPRPDSGCHRRSLDETCGAHLSFSIPQENGFTEGTSKSHTDSVQQQSSPKSKWRLEGKAVSPCNFRDASLLKADLRTAALAALVVCTSVCKVIFTCIPGASS
mmetsp:Transcript_90587/g.255762  ORF Transcript_90587/g.255762 Transcript_90587/m.255762 type:complete len:121 (-) Transcript_90587:16-378(-)